MKKNFVTILFILIFFSVTNAQFLVAQFPFSVNGNDSSGNNFNATACGGATFNNGVNVGNNSSDYALVPKKVFNGLLHCAIAFDVKFDSLHRGGELPRNTILYGPLTVCGTIPLGVFYCKDSVNSQPQNSWLVYFDDKPYVVADSNVTDLTWYHVEIKKDSGLVKFFKNGMQLYSAVDSSDTIHMALNCYIGQFAGCLGNPLTKSLFGAVKNLQVVDFDLFAANIKEEKQNEVLIFPNPSSDEINISFLKEGNYTVKIFDEVGREIKAISDFGMRISDLIIPIENLSPGIYFLEIENKKFSRTIKFVRQ